MINPTVAMGSSVKIGAIAKSVGCHVETVRYYEKVGLIPPVMRQANGYGSYSKQHLDLLRLIRHAKGLGFSQNQIRNLSQLAMQQDNACQDVHRLTKQQLAAIDEKMSQLREMKKDLQALSRSCEKNRNENCPALRRLIVE